MATVAGIRCNIVVARFALAGYYFVVGTQVAGGRQVVVGTQVVVALWGRSCSAERRLLVEPNQKHGSASYVQKIIFGALSMKPCFTF